MNTDKVIDIVFWTAMVILIIGTIWFHYDCYSRGGAVAQSTLGLECVQKR